MTRNEMPVGFAMALGANPAAMQTFSALSREQQQKILDGTHAVKSREEMQLYVASIIEKQ